MSHQFSDREESSAQSGPSSAERMTEDEARAVIELWQSRQDVSALSVLPSVPDVAEGLEITLQEASGFLIEVRAQRQVRDLQRPIETLDESGIQIGKAIEAGRLAAQREQITSEPPTQEMREADALISAARAGIHDAADQLTRSAIIAFFLVAFAFIAAVVFFAHMIR